MSLKYRFQRHGLCKKILSLIYVAKLLLYHDLNFPVVAGMLLGKASQIKDETSNSNRGARDGK